MQYYSLSDAIFDSKYPQYFFYRFRYFFIISLFTILFSYVEFSLVQQLLSSPVITLMITMRLFVGLTSGGWWGLLELMREEVRGRYHFFEKAEVSLSIANWLCLSVIASIVVILLPMGYFISQRGMIEQDELGIYDFYLLGFCIQTFLDFCATTYHSGIYAIRRIYRSMTSLFIGEISIITLMYFFWHIVGPIGLPIAYIFGECINSAIRIYFVHRTHRMLNIAHLRMPLQKNFIKFLKKISLENSLLTYMAGLALHVENLLIIVLLKSFITEPHLLIYSYILRQIYRTFSHWGNLFYYDFKKMRYGPFPQFYPLFLKRLVPLSLLIALIFYGITLLATFVFYPPLTFAYSMSLAIFFLFATPLSYLPVLAFSEHRYKDLIFVGAATIAISLFDSEYLFVALLPFIGLFLSRERFAPTETVDSVKKQSVYTLALHLDNRNAPFRVTKIKIYEMYVYTSSLRGFLSQVAQNIDPRAWICPLRFNEFMVVEPEKYARLTGLLLLDYSGGILESYQMIEAKDRTACLDIVAKELSSNIPNNPFYQVAQRVPKGMLRTNWSESVDYMYQMHFPKGDKIDLRHHMYSNELFNREDKLVVYSSISDFFLYPCSQKKENSCYCAFYFVDTPKLFYMEKLGLYSNKFPYWNQYIHFLNFQYFVNTIDKPRKITKPR